MVNYRIKYSVTGLAKYISHLDMARLFERSMRRAELPLAFSEGFNPHPKISFGSALAVGVSSSGEYLDVQLNKAVTTEIIQQRLNEALPPSVVIEKVGEIEGKEKALMAIINRAVYQVEIPVLGAIISEADIKKAIENLLEKQELKIIRSTKKGPKEKDIRTGIFTISGAFKGEKIIFSLLLAAGSEMNVRPEEVINLLLAEINLNDRFEYAVIHREGLYISKRNSEIVSPLEGYLTEIIE